MSLPESSSDRPRGVLVRQPQDVDLHGAVAHRAGGAGVQLPAAGAGIGGSTAFKSTRRPICGPPWSAPVDVQVVCKVRLIMAQPDFSHPADAARRRAEAADDDLLRAVDHRAGGDADGVPVSVPGDSPLRRLRHGAGTSHVGRSVSSYVHHGVHGDHRDLTVQTVVGGILGVPCSEHVVQAALVSDVISLRALVVVIACFAAGSGCRRQARDRDPRARPGRLSRAGTCRRCRGPSFLLRLAR